MEFTGKLLNISKDWETGQFQITFTINEQSALSDVDNIKDCEQLSVKAVKYRKKRSLDANAYFHVLVGKLADELRISKPRCKNILLGRYGQPFLLEDNSPAVIKSNVPVSQMLEHETFHCMPCGCKKENGQELIFYRMLRGSSTYDTREMSILIDGVISECRELGIETMTPDELERMKAAWRNS